MAPGYGARASGSKTAGPCLAVGGVLGHPFPWWQAKHGGAAGSSRWRCSDRARLRSGRVSLLVVALLVAITGAAAITALTGAQRTITAYDRLRATTGDPDADVTGAPDAEVLDRAADLPEVERSVGGHLWVSRYFGITDRIVYLSMVSYDRTSPGLVDPLVVRGRMWDPTEPREALITEGFARRSGAGPGSILPLKTLLPAQFDAWDQVNPVDARGAEVRLRVVGVIRDPYDAGANGSGLFVSPAFTRYANQVGSPPVGRSTFVRLRGGTDDGERFAAGVQRLIDRYGDPAEDETAELRTTLATDREDVGSAARVAALGLVVFAAVAALAGLVTLTQALGREMARHAEDNAVWAALGMTTRDRALALSAPVLLATAAGTLVALVLAVATSPLSPIGAARTFEPSRGIEVNLALLALGGAAWLALSFGLVALTAHAVRGCSCRRPTWSRRPHRRPSPNRSCGRTFPCRSRWVCAWRSSSGSGGASTSPARRWSPRRWRSARSSPPWRSRPASSGW